MLWPPPAHSWSYRMVLMSLYISNTINQKSDHYTLKSVGPAAPSGVHLCPRLCFNLSGASAEAPNATGLQRHEETCVRGANEAMAVPPQHSQGRVRTSLAERAPVVVMNLAAPAGSSSTVLAGVRCPVWPQLCPRVQLELYLCILCRFENQTRPMKDVMKENVLI